MESCGSHTGSRSRPTEGIRQIGAILHAKAVSATVVKPFGFATGDGEGSRCGIRTRIALQNPVAQVVVAILWGHGPFAIPGQGGDAHWVCTGLHPRDERTKPGEAPQDAPHDVLGRRDAVGGTPSLCQEPSETDAGTSTLVGNAPLSVQNRTNLPDTLYRLVLVTNTRDFVLVGKDLVGPNINAVNLRSLASARGRMGDRDRQQLEPR